MWSIATNVIQVRLRAQLNSILYVKTLQRKDIVSSSTSPSNPSPGGEQAADGIALGIKDGEDDLSSKTQVMTLMTTDVDRVSDLPTRLFLLIGALNARIIYYCSDSAYCADTPLEIMIGTLFLYKLLGKSLSDIFILSMYSIQIARHILFRRSCCKLYFPSLKSVYCEGYR